MKAVNGTPMGGLKVLPIDVGVIHFVGIGGIGMSGIAEVLHNLGYRVQGSDVAESANVARLRRLGVAVQVGHREENLGEAAVVVVSSAIRPGNPEVDGARTRRLPVVRRADMLGELMRLKWAIAVAGTHGKTTTTSLIAGLLDAAGLDPTVINGGIINAYGTNARRGQGEWMVVEADESDGTFVRLPACVAVVTNIDPEHLDHYGDFGRLREAFEAFIENLPFYGFGALCIDHPEVQALLGRVTDRRTVTYGFSPQADIRALDAGFDAAGAVFDVALRDRTGRADRLIPRLRLAMPGLHNVQNALAAIAVARELGLDDDVVRRAFATFGGVGRRFTRTGVVGGITVIDDYGHHPVEIRAVLATARGAYPDGRVVAVVQPHRFTRLQALFEEFCTCFNDADTVFVADVYAAGEAPIAGVDRDALVDGLKRHGHRDARPLPGPEALADAVAGCAGPGDVVVCLGAGSITAWAHALPRDLARVLGVDEVAREGAA